MASSRLPNLLFSSAWRLRCRRSMNCNALREMASFHPSSAAMAKTSEAASCSTSRETANLCSTSRRVSASAHQNIT